MGRSLVLFDLLFLTYRYYVLLLYFVYVEIFGVRVGT